MKVWEAIGAAVPGLLAGWVNSWTNLFSKTMFAPPNSDGSPDLAAAALATVICVILAYLAHTWNQARLKKYAYSSFISALACFVGIFLIRFYLKYPRPREMVETLYEIWTGVYVVALILVLVAILFAVMTLLARRQRKSQFSIQ
jgi:hypothetical protein